MSLSEDFKKVVEEQMPEIESLVMQSRVKLNEAIALANKYGIPFYANPSGVGQMYRPKSFDAIKAGIREECEALDLDEYDVFDELLPDGIGQYQGWQASAICY